MIINSGNVLICGNGDSQTDLVTMLLWTCKVYYIREIHCSMLLIALELNFEQILTLFCHLVL